LTHAMVKSAAISDAGITKQTLYEVGRENFHRQTYDRAMEALDAVNGEIEHLIRQSWGRKGRKDAMPSRIFWHRLPAQSSQLGTLCLGSVRKWLPGRCRA